MMVRSPEELRKKAELFWPSELTAREAATSVIPLLLQTQDKFISLLDVSDAGPDSWKNTLRASKGLKANVFLKHLMVLADVGGELLKRLRPELGNIFPSGTMAFGWQGKAYKYEFKAILNCSRLDNSSMFVDSNSLVEGHDIDDRMEDVAMLLLHGDASVSAQLPATIKDKCIIGSLMGQKAELERFVKQRYILVSRITTGAATNALGQFAQDYVKEILEESLPDWQIAGNSSIPGISQNAGETNINFDIVAKSPRGRCVAIEVSFQVTTNSVVERKSGQAQARAELLRQFGHKIAYVIDGAGNFERRAALRTICRFSDCTVTFTRDEIDHLVQFLRKLEA
mgnify:CR=1 FL=1